MRGVATRIAPTPMASQRVTGCSKALENWKRRERVCSSTGVPPELGGDPAQAAQACDDAADRDEGQGRRGEAPGPARPPAEGPRLGGGGLVDADEGDQEHALLLGHWAAEVGGCAGGFSDGAGVRGEDGEDGGGVAQLGVAARG